MRISRALTCTAVALLLAPEAQAAPIVWADNGHAYELVLSGQISWDQARLAAQALGPGWDLATITSAEEQAFIETVVGRPPGGTINYWLGGFQPAGSEEPFGSWQWINGEGVFWDNGPVPNMYANWPIGFEPNNTSGENHLALDNRYAWQWNDNDPHLWAVYGFVAETAVPEPASLTMLGLGLAGLATRLRRRR